MGGPRSIKLGRPLAASLIACCWLSLGRRCFGDFQDDYQCSDKIQCFSCMSPFYESAWLHLSQAFNKPLNFTYQCDEQPTSQSGVATVDCYSVCITMWEDTTLMGIPFRGYIRGCYDSMLTRGFNQTIVHWYRWLHRDSCHFYNKQEVLQLPLKDRKSYDRTEAGPNQLLHICTCYSNACNGADGWPTGAGHWSKQCRLGLVVSLLTVSGCFVKFFQ